MTSSTDQFPNAAQLAKINSTVETRVQAAIDKHRLRIRAVELAVAFNPQDPMKLAKEIYKFLSDVET